MGIRERVLPALVVSLIATACDEKTNDTFAPSPPTATIGVGEPSIEINETQILRHSIEKDFGVKLTSWGEFFEKERIPFPAGFVDVPWDLERLEMVREFLSFAPKHFINQEVTGRELQILLDAHTRYGAGFELYTASGQGLPPPYDRIKIGPTGFEKNREEQMRASFIHELVHRITPITARYDLAFSRDILPPLESPWFDKVNEILGGPFFEKREELYNKVLEIKPDVLDSRFEIRYDRQNLSDEEELTYFLLDFLYGLGKLTASQDKDPLINKYPHELIGVLAEHYIKGEQYFLKMYGRVLSVRQANQLYDFMKTIIFRH